VPWTENISVATNSQGASHRQREKSESRTGTDIFVYGLVLAFGALQFGLSLRADDFFMGDVTYFELARSLVEKGYYGFDFTPQTTLPPGFPAILAAICVIVGCNFAVMSSSMAVFATLGFIVSYELLRVEEGRTAAAVSCLLLASSPIVFVLSTQFVASDLPYFFTSMLALMFAAKLVVANCRRRRLILWPLCGVFMLGSLLIRSVGIALLVGLFAWVTVSFCFDWNAGVHRARSFLAILILGMVVQASWMLWAAKHEVIQWPTVEGYPKSYVAQLKIKNGNYPELGTVSLSDIPSRVEQNLNEHAVELTKLLTRKDYINAAWYSPLVFGPVLLVLIGVVSSIRAGGGALSDWYFVSYEAMYLLWPWYGEIRFFLPVAPLACLYLWRGGKVVVDIGCRRPRAAGAVSFPVSTFLAVSAVAVGWRSRDLQPELAAAFWALVSAVSAWAAWKGYKLPKAFASLRVRLGVLMSANEKCLPVPRIVGVVTVAALVMIGLVQQVAAGRNNLMFDVTKHTNYADVAAGKWIQANTGSTAVVMARQVDVVYHYSGRRVLWFPPSSDPQLLMDGIRKHKVEFVIVSVRHYSYWLPPESVCFESLLHTYPDAFQLVHEESQFAVFKVVSEHSKIS
jgi:hypothetical protein